MANRDDDRRYRSEEIRGRERWRGDDDAPPRRPGPGERRSFGQEGRFNSDVARYGEDRAAGERDAWRRERYGGRRDEDRNVYGSGYDQDRRDYGHPEEDYLGYAGQEYGVEAPHGPGYALGGPQFPPHADGEFEPDYLSWREEQLRGHDRDYASWRAEQHRRYDDDYRAWRGERRKHFGQTFSQWQAQRSRPATGMGGTAEASVGATRTSASFNVPFSRTPPQAQAAADGETEEDARKAER